MDKEEGSGVRGKRRYPSFGTPHWPSSTLEAQMKVPEKLRIACLDSQNHHATFKVRIVGQFGFCVHRLFRLFRQVLSTSVPYIT